jgi:hypothetical protein
MNPAMLGGVALERSCSKHISDTASPDTVRAGDDIGDVVDAVDA